MQIDPELRSFATARQIEYIDAIEKHGSSTRAAAAIGVNRRSIDRSMIALRRSAAMRGYSPAHDMTHLVPDGFKVKGVSTYYNAEGKPSGQWVKSSADEESQREIMQAAFAAMAEELPRVDASQGPAQINEHLCNLYTLTDSHVGMLAWRKEGGADWDLKIAEAVLTSCFEHMVMSSPAAEIGFVNQLGDFLHSDGSSGLLPVTPLHGNVLDQDGRYSKIVGVAIRILRRLIDFTLARHNKVVLLLAEGNHDMSSSVWLRQMFRALYENEPRIEVIDSELPYYVHQHGQTMLAFHHGHLAKPAQLPLLFAAQFPRVWGATTKRYGHCGHRHCVEEIEYSGMTVTQHATLAARDAYAARGGWMADRQVRAMTYHDTFGLVGMNVTTPEMVEA